MAIGACRWFGVTIDDRLDAVGPRRLGARHLAPVGIAAVGRDAEVGGRGGGVRRVGRERAGDQRDPVVEPHREAVHGADEGVAAAADHPDPEPVRPCPSARSRRPSAFLPV